MVTRVMLVSIDNLRADCVGANPDKGALARFRVAPPATPTLDALTASGTAFFRCYSAAPYTTASHASLLTGLLPPRHGLREYYRTPLRAGARTLFEHFRAAGYVTILATDFPFLLGPNLGFTRAVDHFVEEDDGRVLDLLTALEGRKVFCFHHFGSVHNPFGLTSLRYDGDRFAREVEALERRAGVDGDAPLPEEWPERAREPRERALRLRYFRCTDRLYEEGRYDELMDLYARGIEYFDGNRLRRFLDEMEARGLREEALLAVTADHGEEYSERAFAHFNGLWEGIVNVPLLLLGPGVPAGRRCEALCRTVDVAPTLLDLAGLLPAAREGLDGATLSAQLEGRTERPRTAYGESTFGYTERIRRFMEACRASGGLLAAGNSLASTRLQYVRDGSWKLVARTDLESGARSCALYDVDADPGESGDLASRYPDVARVLAGRLPEEEAEEDDEPLRLHDNARAALAASLREIGYRTAWTPAEEDGL